MATEQTVSITVAELEALREMVSNFHAVKQIRAHAAEENGATKRALIADLDAFIARVS